ncbi:MAG: biotin-independent malonate decarboxylase subunit gamma [Vulcanimicrobiaceae bacterium]
MNGVPSRGALWCDAILHDSRAAGAPPSLCVVDGTIGGDRWRAIAVVPDPAARLPRARAGELGLDEGLALARAVAETPIDAALLAVVDVPGQAFGRREEVAGIHIALGAAVEAYATQRRAGRPIFALVVGKAISGAFLAHGLQAGWIGALDDAGVEVHVMSAASVARVTRTAPADVARLATIVPATARDIASFASFGAIDERFVVADPCVPTAGDALARIRAALQNARAAGYGTRAPWERVNAVGAGERRHARDVRARIAAWWDA